MNGSAIPEWARSGNAVLIAAALMLGLVGCWALMRRKSLETYKSGALLIDGRASQRRAARRKKSGSEVLTLAGIAIPAEDETKPFKLIGTTGTGKSTAIGELL